VKSIFENVEVLKLPFLAISGALNFVNLVNISLQKVQKYIRIHILKSKASKCVKMGDFPLLESPKSSSRKRVGEKS